MKELLQALFLVKVVGTINSVGIEKHIKGGQPPVPYLAGKEGQLRIKDVYVGVLRIKGDKRELRQA